MVNDIQKLQKVIVALEKQSTSVNEFNGILGAVNSAKVDICSAKAAFEKMAKEQKKLVSESYTKFEEYGIKFNVLESKFAAMEKEITKQINRSSLRIEAEITVQAKTISFLRTFVVLGILVLAGLIIYLS